MENLKFEKRKNEILWQALLNMCFCKSTTCSRCTYTEPLKERCKNEQIRDKAFAEISSITVSF